MLRAPPIRLRAPAVLLSIALAVSLVAVQAAPADAAATDHIANCDLNIRSSPSTGAAKVGVITEGTGVSVSGSVTGGWWSTACPSTVSGSSWYRIIAVNGVSVSTVYGVSVVYAATGLFRSGSYLEGIDVSKYQGTIDFARVRAAGVGFVIAKATEGIGYRDASYSTFRSGAIGAGLRMTAYHFARPDLNPTDAVGEADWFVDNMSLAKGMLVPALDLERAGTLGTTALQQWVSAWLARVYARTGVRAMIYTSPSFWKTYLGDTTQFAGQGYTVLWVAHWYTSAPSTPAANWGGRGWTFWQYDSCGTVPGITGCVDLDRYNGTDLTRVTWGADFALSSSPVSLWAKQGTARSYTIQVARSFFTLPVGFSVSGTPQGASATLSPGSTSGGSVTLTVATSNSGTITPTGDYRLTITGAGNGLTRSTTVALKVTDGIGPSVRAPSTRVHAPTPLGPGTANVQAVWSASDPSGISKYALQRQVDGGGWASVGLSSATATNVVQGAEFGHVYRYRAIATDGNGNTGSWSYGPSFRAYLVQESGSGIAWSSGWTDTADNTASGGRLRFAKTSGAAVTYTFTGSSVAWVASRGPDRGSAKIYVDGAYMTTVNLYAASFSTKQVVYSVAWGSNGTHRIGILALGTALHPRVDVDAFVRLVLQ